VSAQGVGRAWIFEAGGDAQEDSGPTVVLRSLELIAVDQSR
jgi:hypothetical protein